ncbi:MAG: dienelactone hydrolase family protein [Acidimicrobiales bacterium]
MKPFTSSSGQTRDVYRTGTGPAVIIIHEIPGITPLVADFARKVADRGMTAVLPSLLGTAGRPMTVPYALSSLARACVSKEFTLLALNKTSPIVDYLRELAFHEREAQGGPGVGAVGMCLTGGFALAMCVEPSVIAPVMSQPSLPLPTNPEHRRALGLSDADLAFVKRRTTEDLCVMGMRFSGDSKSPAERFTRLREVLGDKFIGVEIDSSPGNPWGYKKSAHSVLTEDYTDEDTSPTRRALEELLTFLTSRLGVAPEDASSTN